MLKDPTLRTGYLMMLALPIPALLALVLVLGAGWPLWGGLVLLAVLDALVLGALWRWARARRAP